MLKTLRLRNYKCFLDSSIVFKSQTILVGKNNAGKSTLIEALRLVAMAGKKSLNSNFSPALAMYNFPIDYKGIRIDTDKLKIDLRNAIYFYDETYATVEAVFDDKSKIEVYINTDVAFAVFFDCTGENIWKKERIAQCGFNKISIMPQIGPIRENEKILLKDTILNDRETYLSSRHFRNEINYFKKDKYAAFKALAEDTWDGLKLIGLEQSGEYLSLMIQDAYFPCEIGLMGSGLQIWLQIIWFLCKANEANTLIFDEPDIYMHPDLQIKLFRLLQQRNIQIIIATHSVEIISLTEPNYLAYIDKSSREIKYANSSNAAQKIIDDIGGISNLSLLRINLTKKVLFMRANSLEILRAFSAILFPRISPAIDAFPCVTIQGKSQLAEAFGVSRIFQAETSGSIECICILDHDFSSDKEFESAIDSAKKNSLQLIVWQRREIENYLLNPKVIFRTIQSREPEFGDFLTRFIEVVDSFLYEPDAQHFFQKKHVAKPADSDKFITGHFAKQTMSLEEKIAIVPGRKTLQALRDMLRTHYHTLCSINDIICHFKTGEIPEEIQFALNTIYNINEP